MAILVLVLVALASPPGLAAVTERVDKLGRDADLWEAPRREKAAPDAGAAGGSVRSMLMLRGYEQAGASFRDTATPDERQASSAGRLAQGQVRLAMPGETPRAGVYDAPMSRETTSLPLDIAGCPVIEENMVFGPEFYRDGDFTEAFTKALDDGVRSAKNPATCRDQADAQAEAFTAEADPDVAGVRATTREAQANVMGLTTSALMLQQMTEILEEAAADADAE